MVSTRDIIRTLRRGEITSKQFLDTIRQNTPQHIRRTPTATLEHFVLEHVPTINPSALVEMLKMTQLFIQTPDFKKEGTNISNVVNRIRTAIKTRFGPDSPEYTKAKKLLYFKKEDMILKDQKYAAKIDELNEHPIEVKQSSIDAIMNDTRTDIPTLALKLQLASGARSIELLKIGNFKATAGNIEQTGVAKTTDGKQVVILKPLILMDADQFNRDFKRIRELLSDDLALTNEELKIKYNAKITKRLKNITGGALFKSHTLRKLYGLISFKTRPEKFLRWSQQKFLSYVLGHSNMNTARVYSTVMILDDTAEKDDEPVEIPRNTKNRDGNGLERLRATVAEMKRQGIKITVQALKDLGYGARLITQFRKGL